MHYTASQPCREHELLRDPNLGFEPAGVSVVRCLEHGHPWPLERWHYHDEYELQLIVETHGRAFVGDYIGHYAPNHLRSRRPTITAQLDRIRCFPQRRFQCEISLSSSLTSRFARAWRCSPSWPTSCRSLTARRHGIQFFGISDDIRKRFYQVKESRGLERFSEFTHLLLDLSRCQNYQLLSTVRMQSAEDPSSYGTNQHRPGFSEQQLRPGSVDGRPVRAGWHVRVGLFAFFSSARPATPSPIT